MASMEEALRNEGNSTADVERLTEMFREIEEANPSMPPRIYKPDATIEYDSRAGEGNIDGELFSETKIEKLRSLGKKLVLAKTEKITTKMKKEIFEIIKDYVVYFHPDELYSLEVSEGGWTANLSMPGYSDQTDPIHYNTLAEAIEDLHRMYAD